MPALTYGQLATGDLLVFSARSPAELYLSSMELFGAFSDTVFPLVEAAGERAAAPGPVVPGARLLAHDGEAWYRALVLSAPLPGGKAEVFLLDLGSSLTVGAAELRAASPELFLHPVTAVPACLAGWEQEDAGKAAEEWGAKMAELVPEQYSEVAAEVGGRCPDSGRCTVKVAGWEAALARKPSKAELLSRMKAKAKAQ